MGLAKAWLPFGDERLLPRVVRILGEVAGPLVVVAASDQPLPPLPSHIHVTHDRQPDRGPLEGLAAGLSVLESEVSAAYVTACDVPLLVPEFVTRLAQLLEDHDVAVPVDEKYYHSLSAVYRTSVLSVAETLLAEDRLRPFYLFEEVKTRRVTLDELRQVDPELASLRNVNSPDEYFSVLADAGLEPDPDIVKQLRRS